jgi:hypothetical protein
MNNTTAATTTITLILHGTRGTEAHKPGCRDISRTVATRDFTFTDIDDLDRQISIAVVGNLEDAIAETGDPNGGWTVDHWAPCTRSLA